jgi:oligoendopeptidase F
MHRFDYTPDDNVQFLDSIREVVVPAMLRLMERRKELLGLETLRPWDMQVDPTGKAGLSPFKDAAELIEVVGRMFEQLNPDLSGYYNNMRDNRRLDLDNRANKAPGGFCAPLPVSGQSLIFMNAVGIHDDVQTLLHEAGHAFHNYESFPLPYTQQEDYPIEFAEVASMAMELLAAPYLAADNGGFYSDEDAARARIEHLEGLISFWCYMSVVDSFQHWAYTNPGDAHDPTNCNAKWTELWDTYLPGVDWSGLEDIKATGWQRKLHIYHIPFYYLEYGLAQLGAVQIWRNSLADYDKALADYRHGLSLGNTRTLPELFEAAGARLAFDAELLSELVDLIESTIHELSA